jgi:hypothetical protein
VAKRVGIIGNLWSFANFCFLLLFCFSSVLWRWFFCLQEFCFVEIFMSSGIVVFQKNIFVLQTFFSKNLEGADVSGFLVCRKFLELRNG